MKQILLAFTIFFALGATAQTVHIDSSTSRIYVNVTPIPLGFLDGSLRIERLYGTPRIIVPLSTWSFSWDLCFKNQIDGTTVEYVPIISGSMQLPVSGELSQEEVYQYLFQYVEDNGAFGGKSLNISIID